MNKFHIQITFENCFNFALGSCDVDMITFGSSTPAQRYSSSSAVRVPIEKQKQGIN
jgi:hypothetical protein